MMEEVWKPVKGYEGYYEVSCFGNVRSVERYDTIGRKKHGVMLSGCNNGNGYLSVQLAKDGCKKRKYIHRLVAESFVHRVENNNEVNHKDENTLNNRADNLEWCNRKYNCNYGNHNNKLSESKGSKFVVTNNVTGAKMLFNSKDVASKVLKISYNKIVQGIKDGRISYLFRQKKRDFSFKVVQ
nr:NUMOD4 motif-containing HNH endonuclease [Lactiplantibacillus plantarum]